MLAHEGIALLCEGSMHSLFEIFGIHMMVLGDPLPKVKAGTGKFYLSVVG